MVTPQAAWGPPTETSPSRDRGPPSKGEYFHSGAAAAGDMNASPCPGISPIPEESQLFNCFPNENSLPKWVRLHKRNHKLFKPKLRAPKCLQSLFEGRAVGWGFRTA